MQKIKKSSRNLAERPERRPVIVLTDRQRRQVHEAGLRGERIRAARRLIERGGLDTPERLDVACDRMIEDVVMGGIDS